MQATADSLAFAPPPEPAAFRGFLLAAIAHILLIVALSLGINWDKDTPAEAVEAELWSATPQQAAPPPAPPPPPQKVVEAPRVVQPPPPPVVAKQPDIAVEREKKRRQEEAQRRQEEEQERKLQEAQRRKLEEQQRLADEKKERLAEEKRLKDEQAKKDRQKKELEAKKLEQLRKENLARMMNEAAGAGAPSSRGAAAKASGPSDSYAGRIRARVKPNIVFTDDIPGNPSTEVEVRMAPDGTITSTRITKASGAKAWDEAVLRALDKTEVLPRDIDGRVHTPLIIEFKLRG